MNEYKCCIFICIFNQEKYVDMFYLLLESIYSYGNLTEETDILILLLLILDIISLLEY